VDLELCHAIGTVGDIYVVSIVHPDLLASVAAIAFANSALKIQLKVVI